VLIYVLEPEEMNVFEKIIDAEHQAVSPLRDFFKNRYTPITLREMTEAGRAFDEILKGLVERRLVSVSSPARPRYVWSNDDFKYRVPTSQYDTAIQWVKDNCKNSVGRIVVSERRPMVFLFEDRHIASIAKLFLT